MCMHVCVCARACMGSHYVLDAGVLINVLLCHWLFSSCYFFFSKHFSVIVKRFELPKVLYKFPLSLTTKAQAKTQSKIHCIVFLYNSHRPNQLTNTIITFTTTNHPNLHTHFQRSGLHKMWQNFEQGKGNYMITLTGMEQRSNVSNLHTYLTDPCK